MTGTWDTQNATGWNIQDHTEPPFWSNLVSVPHQVSRFFSLASLSYFSRVLLSTIPVRYLAGQNSEDMDRGMLVCQVFDWIALNVRRDRENVTYMICPPMVDLPASGGKERDFLMKALWVSFTRS